QDEEALPDIGVDSDIAEQDEEGILNAAASVGAVPQKRMLKFLLPEAPQFWVQDDSMSELGSKRGLSNKNKNFLRFGRGRDKNFLRFGRGRNQNFLRFGRSGLAADGGVLDAAKRARTNNFLRFGRTRNYLRFGRSDSSQGMNDLDLEETSYKRGADRNYLRFGRSTQEYNRSVSEATRGSHNGSEQQMKDTTTFTSKQTDSAEPILSENGLTHLEKRSSRSKRSYPSVFDFLMEPIEVEPTWSPMSESMNSDDDEIEAVEEEPLQDEQERYRRGRGNSNFLRFGRQRNYLRFGKRSGVKSWYRPVRTAMQYPRAHRNFLRFG
ncbi:unnamed protein product, partial [Meganyctiphanes norvegica]